MNNMEFIDGMNKAWDLAFRLIGEDEDILLKIFGTAEVDEIISNNEPQYALKKLEEYDNENGKEYLPDTNVGNKDGWIPVEERLPDNNEPVLCWVKSTTIASGETYIIGSCSNKCWFLQTYEIGHHYFPVKDYEVAAWMPLPEPYKEKGE